MKNRTFHLLAVLAALLIPNLQPSTAFAQGTAFTYQGQLQNSGAPASGIYNLQFSLYTNSTGGTAIAGPITNSAVGVTNGLFTVAIDFGSGPWNGETNWLQIGVETNGSNSFTALAPRQQLTPVPYAISAQSLNGTVGSSGLSGTYGNQVNLNNSANQFNGSYAGNGGGLTNVNAATLGGLAPTNFWQTRGNAGTTAGVNFVGTTDNQPLELHANGQRIFQLLPDTSTNNAPDIVGGSPTNTMTLGLVGATISGGAWNSIGPASLYSSNNPYGDMGAYPSIGASFSTIGGGFLNEIQSNATFSTVAGGALNTIQAGAIESTIGGGFGNMVLSNGLWSAIGGGTHHSINGDNGFIGGGWNNTIQFDGSYSAIGGGQMNNILDYADHAFIGGGQNNTIVGSFTLPVYGVIAGGYFNTIQTNSSYGFIGGGYDNTLYSGASYSMLGGGLENQIQSPYSVIAGGQSDTIYSNAFYSTISGGYDNLIYGYAPYSTIGGGLFNQINGDTNDYGTSVIAGGYFGIINSNSWNSFIGGGGGNTIGTNSDHSVIVGGNSNTLAVAEYGTIGGGVQNTVGAYAATVPGGNLNFAGGAASFAAGQHAQATNDGAFVWSDDSTTNSFSSTTSNQFNVRAMGGVRLVTGGAGMTLDGQGLGPLGNYVFAYSTAPQIVAPSIFQNANFTTTAQINNWVLISSQQFQCDQAGLYLVHYTAEAHIVDSMSMRGILNSAEISGSQAYASTSGFTITTTISQSFLVSASVGNILSIQYTGNNSTDELEPGGSGLTLPSISLTITRIQ